MKKHKIKSEIKCLLIIVILVFIDGKGMAINTREATKICQRSSNYTKCVKKLLKKDEPSKVINRPNRRNYPVRLKVVPYYK